MHRNGIVAMKNSCYLTFLLGPPHGALGVGKLLFPLLLLRGSGGNGGLLSRGDYSDICLVDCSVLGPSQANMQIVKLISTLRFELVVFLGDLYNKTANRKVEPFSEGKYIFPFENGSTLRCSVCCYKSTRKTTNPNRKVEINFTICIIGCDGPKTEHFTVTHNEMRRGRRRWRGGGGRGRRGR